MNIIKTTDYLVPARAIADAINKELFESKKVLWLVAGGSSMAVAVEASRLVEASDKLNIMLTDERYGEPGDKDSNEVQLKNLGFVLPLQSVLLGEDKIRTVQSFSDSMQVALANADTVFGLFGIGADGHVAGIMPESVATLPDVDYAVGYQAATFYRLTITPKVIKELHTAYIWMQGENKKEAFERLLTDYPKEKQPGQHLKIAKEVYIYTDLQ